MSWDGFGVDPHSNFEMMLHLLRILPLIFRSKFQLIQDGFFLKGNSIIYNFFRNRESQISTFFWPKIRFNLLLKIMTFFEHFSIFFFIFHGTHLQNFLKEQIRCRKGKHLFYFFLNEIKWNPIKNHI